MTEQQLKDELEALVDGSTLRDVVIALASVCYEKAEHLEVNWQDHATARTWTMQGAKLDRISEVITL